MIIWSGVNASLRLEINTADCFTLNWEKHEYDRSDQCERVEKCTSAYWASEYRAALLCHSTLHNTRFLDKHGVSEEYVLSIIPVVCKQAWRPKRKLQEYMHGTGNCESMIYKYQQCYFLQIWYSADRQWHTADDREIWIIKLVRNLLLTSAYLLKCSAEKQRVGLNESCVSANEAYKLVLAASTR